jgi:hypothetical protein
MENESEMEIVDLRGEVQAEIENCMWEVEEETEREARSYREDRNEKKDKFIRKLLLDNMHLRKVATQKPMPRCEAVTDSSFREEQGYGYLLGKPEHWLLRAHNSLTGWLCWGLNLLCNQCCKACPSSYQVIEEAEEGLVFRYKKLYRVQRKGLAFINPFTETIEVIDKRVSIEILDQQVAYTQDSIKVYFNASLYVRVVNPVLARFRLNNLKKTVKEVCAYAVKLQVATYKFQDFFTKITDLTIES